MNSRNELGDTLRETEVNFVSLSWNCADIVAMPSYN